MGDRLKDKVAIITGGAQGIGKAIAKAFVREGAKVALAARTLANLEKTVEELKAMGGDVIAIPTDITVEQQVIDMVPKVINAFGKIDILVNNSGIGGPVSNVVDMKLDEWNYSFAVDLTGSMLCAREVLKHMIPRKTRQHHQPRCRRRKVRRRKIGLSRRGLHTVAQRWVSSASPRRLPRKWENTASG